MGSIVAATCLRDAWERDALAWIVFVFFVACFGASVFTTFATTTFGAPEAFSRPGVGGPVTNEPLTICREFPSPDAPIELEYDALTTIVFDALRNWMVPPVLLSESDESITVETFENFERNPGASLVTIA